MHKRYYPFLYFGTCFVLVLTLLVSSCGDKLEACVTIPETSAITINVQIEQFQDSLAHISSKEELKNLLIRQPLIRDYIFRRSEYPNDSIFLDALYQRFTNPHIDTLFMETKRVFGDLSSLKAEFTEAFTNLTYYYPDFVVPKIQTIVSGLDTDLLVSDTLIIISLDFYLGEGARFRPNLYTYLLRKYDPEDIVPSCLLIYGISDRFNKTTLSDKTVLADMIAYGKSFYFAKHMLPCVPDSVFIWYTHDEINGSKKNEDAIWARFIESQVLFDVSNQTKQAYLSERPITTQVGEKCPGRIGQWIGWRIVDRYMQTHPAVTLPQLMEMDNAQQLFKESKYKPSRR